MLTVSTGGHKIPTNPFISMVLPQDDGCPPGCWQHSKPGGENSQVHKPGPPFPSSSQSASRSLVELSPGSVLVRPSGSRDRTHQPKPHHANRSQHIQMAYSTMVLAAFWGLRPLRRQRQQGTGSQLRTQPKQLQDAPHHEVQRIPSHLHAGAAPGVPRHPRMLSPKEHTTHVHHPPETPKMLLFTPKSCSWRLPAWVRQGRGAQASVHTPVRSCNQSWGRYSGGSWDPGIGVTSNCKQLKGA